jgi:hypothetical protein
MKQARRCLPSAKVWHLSNNLSKRKKLTSIKLNLNKGMSKFRVEKMESNEKDESSSSYDAESLDCIKSALLAQCLSIAQLCNLN